ncbi:hypothetical protein BDV18DRAFT_13390 [Aspergillus unguis]
MALFGTLTAIGGWLRPEQEPVQPIYRGLVAGDLPPATATADTSISSRKPWRQTLCSPRMEIVTANYHLSSPLVREFIMAACPDVERKLQSSCSSPLLRRTPLLSRPLTAVELLPLSRSYPDPLSRIPTVSRDKEKESCRSSSLPAVRVIWFPTNV